MSKKPIESDGATITNNSPLESHKVVGADAIVGHKLAESTKKYAVCIKTDGATLGTGGPGGSPVFDPKDTEEFASASGIDGAGIKTKSVPSSDKYDITGTDVAVTRANDATRRGVKFSPPSDHTVTGKNHFEKAVETALGTVEGRA